MNNFTFPKQLSPAQSFDLISRLDQLLPEAKDVIQLDFSALEFSTPFAILTTGSAIRGLVERAKVVGSEVRATFPPSSNPATSYLNNNHFLDFIGFPDSVAMGTYTATKKHLPITRVVRADFAQDASLAMKVDTYVDDLVGVISGYGPEAYELRMALKYSTREVIRNVFEHSGADACYIMAQSWKNDYVEVAIIDEGVGLMGSLREITGDINNQAAMMKALKPGFSRAMGLSDEENVFNNSGYGLYVLSNFSKSFGTFMLASGDRMLIQRGVHPDMWRSGSTHGTAVGFKIDRKYNSNFSSMLSDIIQVGEMEAEGLGYISRASTSSKSIFMKK